MNGPHLKVRWVVAHWKHIDREKERERHTLCRQLTYVRTSTTHPLLPCPLCMCVCASISKVIQARKNFGNWKFAHKNLSPFSSCALGPLPPSPSSSLSCLSVCGTFHYAIYQATSIFAPPSSSPRRKKKLLSGALLRRQKTSWSAWIVYVDKFGCSFFYIGEYPVISRGRRVA